MADLAAATRKELAATAVLAVPLAEASLKQRAGGPVDDPSDIEAGVWGGHIPMRRVACAPVGDNDSGVQYRRMCGCGLNSSMVQPKSDWMGCGGHLRWYLTGPIVTLARTSHRPQGSR